VTYFIAASFIEMLVSAPRRWRDIMPKHVGAIENIVRIKHRVVHLLVLHKFLKSEESGTSGKTTKERLKFVVMLLSHLFYFIYLCYNTEVKSPFRLDNTEKREFLFTSHWILFNLLKPSGNFT
jgi:hypothetical protein